MKKQVILMSLAIAGLFCCIPMFVLNAPGAPGLSGGAASLLGMAGAVLFGTCAGTLLQLKLPGPGLPAEAEGPMRRAEPGHPGPGRLSRRAPDPVPAGDRRVEPAKLCASRCP